MMMMVRPMQKRPMKALEALLPDLKDSEIHKDNIQTKKVIADTVFLPLIELSVMSNKLLMRTAHLKY